MFQRWLLALACLVVAVVALPSSVAAQTYEPMTPEQLAAEIQEFAGVGADAYIMWQYSGYRWVNPFGNDQYSWFRDIEPGPAICATLKENSGQGIKVGVNIWSLTQQDEGTIQTHLSYLRETCGVEIIRVFAYPGGAGGVERVMNVASNLGIQVVVAIGDYSNGGGGVPGGAGKDWYASGYKGEYLSFANEVIGVLSRFSGSVYAVELANEAHCGGDASALPAYIAWGKDIGGRIKGAGLPSSYGQFASHPASACDSPSLGDPSAFTQSNSIGQIDKASGHYYNIDEKTSVLLAAEQAQAAGKIFYVGEAGWGGESLTKAQRYPYYLYPIPGLNTQDKDTIIKSLTNQGYQVQCTAPRLLVESKLGGATELLDRLTPRQIPIGAEQKTDYTNAAIPVLRGTNSTNIFSSLETFWGLRSSQENTGKLVTYNSAPLYYLLDLNQQCVYQMSILETIDKMCNKLAEPSKCALYKPIPQSTYTTKTLLPVTQGIISAQGSKAKACQYLIKNENLSTEEKAAYKSLTYTPLFLDKAYRIGFLVMAAEMKNDGPQSFFNFLIKGKNDADPKDEVRVIAFKFPDFGTNKDFNSDIYYDDPLTITRRVYQDFTSQKNWQNQEISRRNDLQANALKAQAPSELADLAVNCFGEKCGGPVAQALVSIINANGQSCDVEAKDLGFEESGRIKTSANITPSEDRLLADPTQDYDPVQELADQGIDPKLVNVGDSGSPFSSFNFLAQRQVGNKTAGDGTTKIRSFLILPYGSEMEAVTDTLLGQIFTKEGVESFKEAAKDMQYFKIADIEQELLSDKPSINLNGVADQFDSCRKNPSDPTDDACEAQVYLESDQTDAEPRITGGWLGYVTREFQRAISGIGTGVWDYVSSCKTTEDFLLGTCTSKKPGTDRPDDDTQLVSSQCIAAWVPLSTAQEYANAIRANLPEQLSTRSGKSFFAGWDRYFSGIPGTQYLFENCPGQRQTCYDYILDRVLSESDSDGDGLVLNPYLAIAISLNETGGLKSVEANGAGRHFGCGIDPERPGTISVNTIDNKLACLIDFFNRHDSDGENSTSNQALDTYGYNNGYRNANLNKIIGILATGPNKDTNYQSQCN